LRLAYRNSWYYPRRREEKKMFSRLPLFFVSKFMAPLILVLLLSGTARAFEIVTAEEGYELIRAGEAVLLDVRSTEEARVLGSPALEQGGAPIGYIIPYELRLGRLAVAANPFFDDTVKRTFGDEKDQPIIIMCHTGRRATESASRLEDLGFTNVLVMEDPQNPGNVGGFGGVYSYGSYGWPIILPGNFQGSPEVTWLGSGLPVTNRIDPEKVPSFFPTIPKPSSTFQFNDALRR